jgi:uncharacterized membrane protein YphA (DoxX/SURF4 family)
LVIIGEIGGGAVVVLGKLVPEKLYKFSVRILILITLATAIFVHIAGISGNVMTEINATFKDLIIVAVLVQICHSKITCPFGITGEKN